MSESKIHYASVEFGNESNPHDEWGDTACGLEIENRWSLTNKIKEVTCKNCLKVIEAKNKPSTIKK